MAVSEETQACLEQAKKGKARKFVMLTKGADVVGLVLFKKGANAKYVKEAKEQGKGTVCFGVVEGRGMDLTFKVAEADGFTKAPVRTAALKSFLEEEADFKCKPLMEVVKQLPLALDEDDPLVARFLRLQPQVLKACEAHPDRETELGKACETIGKLLDQGDTESAQPKLEELEKLLKSLGDSPAQASTAPTSKSDDGLAAKLRETLNKLAPQIKDFIAARPELKTSLLAPLVKIKEQIDQGDLEAAKSGLLQAAKLLKEAAGNAPASGGTASTDAQREYEQKREAIQADYERALSERLGDVDKFRTVWTYVQEQAEAGVFGNAVKALERLAVALQTALAAAPAGAKSGFSLVKLSTARLELEPLQLTAIEKIKEVRALIVEEFEDDETQADRLPSALKDLDKVIQGLEADIPKQLDKILNAEAAERADRIQKFRGNFDKFREFVDKSPILGAIDFNEYLPDTHVISPVRDKLREINEALG
ncbi:MAG: hypothetical protein U0939_01205 [Pirellulales bacterium]